MDAKTNANLQAFPVGPSWTPETGLRDDRECGLTKRELFAAMAMQGALANPEFNTDFAGYAKDAVQWADALLAELAKEQAR